MTKTRAGAVVHPAFLAAAVAALAMIVVPACESTSKDGSGPGAVATRPPAERRHGTTMPATTRRVPGTEPLPIGRSISVEPLVNQDVGSLPINMVLSPDGRFALCTSQGYREHLCSIRTSDGAGVSYLNFQNRKKSDDPKLQSKGLYYGLAVSADGLVYAAQGAHDTIAVVRLHPDGKLERVSSLQTEPNDFPSGLALDGRGRLYVADNDPEAKPPVIHPGSIAIYDTTTRQALGRYSFKDSFNGTTNFPLAIAVTKDGRRLYVGSQRDDAVYVLDTSDPAAITPVATLRTGSHPIALLLSADESRLFVANAHSDTVSFVNTKSNQVTHTVLLRPDIARSLAGATPTGLALAPGGKSLYASLGDMNAVAVVDVPDAELEGYVAAGWYPSAVVVAPDGKRLLISNAKGTTVRNPNPPKGTTRQVSPLAILEGDVVSVAVPTKEQLKAQTQKVLENNRLTPKFMETGNPLKHIGLQAGKIKHVIYIVKENRTYDHVLGDDPRGNGDPKYCLFGKAVTPNQHALAERFVLMDNFYDSGEVSGDGWTWSTQAMANEYVIRNVPYSYSDRGRIFDYEGTNNGWLTGGFPATGPDGKPLSEHPDFKDKGAPAFPDVAEAPGGHLWDLAKKHNLTVRNYGFHMSNGIVKDGKQVVPDNYPASAGLQPGGRDLGGVTDVDFRKFDMDYPDSDAWHLYQRQTGDKRFDWPKTKFGHYNAPSRFWEWNREFQMMLKKDPTGGAMPNLMLVRLCTDHTAGANPGKKSPKAMVADNDYAVGQLVEAVSKSPIWKHCAIFIIEDDAQNGPDHVDAHRSTCYVISPYIKRGSVDHAFHNTSSCLRTIELLLGLPPMCQYDAVSAPIMNWTDTPDNAEPFAAVLPPADVIRDTNPPKGEIKPISPEQARAIEDSEKMDFAHADKAPADRLNEIIWKTVKGWEARPPETPRSLAGVQVPKVKDDDDD